MEYVKRQGNEGGEGFGGGHFGVDSLCSMARDVQQDTLKGPTSVNKSAFLAQLRL